MKVSILKCIENAVKRKLPAFLLCLAMVFTMMMFISGNTGKVYADSGNPHVLTYNDINYETNADGITLTKYKFVQGESPTDIEIPKYVTDEDNNKYEITKIGASAFTGITSVKFADDCGITEIGNRAFKSCGLKQSELRLPESIRKIGLEAFDTTGSANSGIKKLDMEHCKYLKEIGNASFRTAGIETLVLPPKVEKIGNNAFYGNYIKGEVKIPGSTEKRIEMSISTFDGNFNQFTLDLTSYEPNSLPNAPWTWANTTYRYVKWSDANMDTESDTPFRFDTKQQIIYGLKDDFQTNKYSGWDPKAKDANGELTGVLTIPAKIGDKYVLGFSDGALGGASSDAKHMIKTIRFEENGDYKITKIPTSFANTLRNLEHIENVPKSITELEDFAFAYTARNSGKTMSPIVFPSVNKIGRLALVGGKYTTLTFGASDPIEIDTDTRAFADSVTDIYFTNQTPGAVIGKPWGATYASIHWGNIVEEPDVVKDNTQEWLFDPGKGQIVGYLGPEGNDVDLVVPAKLTKGETEYSITIVGNGENTIMSGREGHESYSKYNFKSVKISDGIKEVKPTAFSMNGTIGSLDLGNTIEIVTGFSDCGIPSLTLPNSVKKIEWKAFSNNKISGKLVIPKNVETIAGNAFAENPGIDRIDIMQYRYEPTDDKYRKASNSIVIGGNFGASNVGNNIFFRDDPRPTTSHRVTPNAEDNTATITFTSKMSNPFYIIKDMEKMDKMPELTIVSRPDKSSDGNKVPLVATMNISSKTAGNIRGGNGDYSVNITYGEKSKDNDANTGKYTASITPFHSITYNANNGNKALSGAAPVDNELYVKDYKPTIKDKGTMNIVGYDFAGWNTKANGTGTTYAAGATTYSMPNSNATLYAVWKPASNTVNFVAGEGGKSTSPTTTKVNTNSKVGVTPSATADDGYKFTDRWVCDQDGQEYTSAQVKALVINGAKNTVTFTAKFILNEDNTITYRYGEGSITLPGGGTEKFKEYTAAAGSPFDVSDEELPKPEREGYTLKGWSREKPSNYPAENADGIVLDAVWEGKNNTVQFAAGEGGTCTERSAEIKSGEQVGFEPHATPNKGYKLAGWICDDGNRQLSTEEVAADIVSGLKNPVTYTAVFEAKSLVTVTFDFAGGTDSDGNETFQMTDYVGDPLNSRTVPEPTREFYTFKGWDVDIPATYPTDALTINAVWEESLATDADKAAATEAIAAIKADAEATKTSTDGKDVSEKDNWVTQANKDAIDAAVKAAEEAVAKENLTQKSLAEALAVLKEAKTTFDTAKKAGSAENPNNITEDVTPDNPSPTVAVVKLIESAKNDNDLKGSSYAPIKLMSKKQKNNSITLNWTKVKGANQYTIYGSECGKGKKYKKLVTVYGSKKSYTVNSIVNKKLKKGKYYKFMIIAEKGDKTIAISKTMHVTTKGHKKNDNHKKVTVSSSIKKKAQKLKAGKSVSLKAKAVAPTGRKVAKHVAVRYESSNKKVATVTKSGKVKGVKKGTCYIYAYAQNGVAVKVKVKVK